jgi:hypothetical protein
LVTRTSKDLLVTGIIVLVLIMTLARQGLPSRAGHRAGDRRYRVMRNDLTLALRRFRLAYLLKGSVFTVDDLVPPPSAAAATAPRQRRVRRRGRRPEAKVRPPRHESDLITDADTG